MKKICILQNSMNYGGTDTFVINLCKGLVLDGYDVTVVLSMDKDEIPPREKDLIDTGVRIKKTCNLNGTISKFKHLNLLYKELKKEKYDVFHSNIDLFNGPQMLIAWIAGIKIRVCHSHNSQQGRELNHGKTLSVKIYQKIMRWFCWNFSNRRCGCSESALNFLFQDKWKKDSMAKVIHNGIDLSVYKNVSYRRKEKQNLGIKNKYNICTVGRVSYQKNPEFILDTFFELSKIRDDIHLLWCGSGEDEKKIKSKIENYNLGNMVEMLGSRNDIPKILENSDLFFLPSRFEGLGIVLVEAQAAGLPCVISDVIPHEVDCGLCYPISLKDSPNYWALQINNILEEKIVFHLDEEKLNKYSISTMIKEMEEVFE